MSTDSSCPNCDSHSMRRRNRLAISRLKKIKMDICALCCGRRYCGVGIYESYYKCSSCGWKGDPNRSH
ncbi:uncharacterized protein LOC27208019 [Drosophila simulans]|uniref:LITAF domain-containing protein n=1 Tax=Drosophila simulans TaxID=7240 RepID=A0A0J9RJ36_DROSI|nr:uncharacterized protein LOC27208019 [Drosophila simulans]XP_044778701.1 uncharacterized protein LOC27208019 [Drosophila simulans]KMY95842.1 uncharacterized protein Dsimw501_GD28170 [Drosophila simulans]